MRTWARLRAAAAAWVCAHYHPNVIAWEPGTITTIYLQCTQDGCRRRSPGVTIDQNDYGPMVRPVMQPFWWRRYARKRYVGPDGITPGVRKVESLFR